MTERRTAYRHAGVDVDAGDRAVELMRAHVDSTRRPEVVGGLGGFGGAFSIPKGYREPLLVASTDGVGTKTAIAAAVGRFDTIGIDLVAMCADDVVCTGAEPLAFLDYVAVGLLDPVGVAELVGSVAAGCREAGAALVGGETAEHPGLMEADEFDLAGCCIGVVERDRVIDGSAVREGDVILGLASSGLHANGFSLVRALIAQWDLDLARAVPGAPPPDARRCDERRSAPRRAARDDGDARRGRPDTDDASTRGPSSRSGRHWRTRARTSTAPPTSRVAGCPATFRGHSPRDLLRDLIRGGGRCHR